MPNTMRLGRMHDGMLRHMMFSMLVIANEVRFNVCIHVCIVTKAHLFFDLFHCSLLVSIEC